MPCGSFQRVLLASNVSKVYVCFVRKQAPALGGPLCRILHESSRAYFAHTPARNKYLSRRSSLCAADCASRNITGHPSAAEYAGHFGKSGPLGSPLRAKFAQYFCIVALSWRSSGLQLIPALESSWPNTYSISAE